MTNDQMTVAEYAVAYDIPKSTVKGWTRDGTLEVDRTKNPMVVKSGQRIPYKNPDIHGWRYQWK